MAIIERAVLETVSPEQAPAPLSVRAAMGTVVGHDASGHPIIRQGWKSVDQIAVELRAKYPQPFTDCPLGVDIIREDRDSR